MDGLTNAAKEPRCEECGFSLTGHARNASPPRCPECGVAFDFEKPWMPEDVPDAPRITWRLCAPVMAVLGLFVAAAFTEIGRNLLVWPFLLIWASAIGAIGLLWPIGWTYETVNAQVPRCDRTSTAWRWLTPVLLINGSAMVVATVVFFLLL